MQQNERHRIAHSAARKPIKRPSRGPRAAGPLSAGRRPAAAPAHTSRGAAPRAPAPTDAPRTQHLTLSRTAYRVLYTRHALSTDDDAPRTTTRSYSRYRTHGRVLPRSGDRERLREAKKFHSFVRAPARRGRALSAERVNQRFVSPETHVCVYYVSRKTMNRDRDRISTRSLRSQRLTLGLTHTSLVSSASLTPAPESHSQHSTYSNTNRIRVIRPYLRRYVNYSRPASREEYGNERTVYIVLLVPVLVVFCIRRVVSWYAYVRTALVSRET